MSTPSPYPGSPHPPPRPGPARTLTLDLKKTPMMLTKPWVRIDGHRFKVRWGTVHIQVPADRPCLVEAYLPFFGGASGTASGSFWLYPEHPPYLEYSAPYNAWFSGQVGPPGATRHHGKAAALVLLGLAACVLLGATALGVLAALL